MPKRVSPLVKEKTTQNDKASPLVVTNIKKVIVKIIKAAFAYRPKNYTPILVTLLIIAAFLVGVLYTKVQSLEQNQGYAGNIPDNTIDAGGNLPQPGQKVDVEIGKLPVLGNENAKVTVIVFADFQCPYCKRLTDETIPQIKKDYVDTGKVKLAYRHFAFLGEESNWSAEASECANEQGKFWEFHDYLYANQGAENAGVFSKNNLKGFAASLGLNTTQFNSCLDSGKYTQAVADDVKGGQTAGVTATPTLFVNGVMLVGAEPYTTIKPLIEKALTE